jgi:cobalt-zinc-cadmium resistance protein CzcA
MMPDLSIGYFSQTIMGTQDVNGVSRNFGQGFRFTGVQAGISVPLWIIPYTSRAKAARISENIARTNAENYDKSLTGSYQSLLDEYSKYMSSVDYYEKQAVPEADIIIDQATRSYKAGALDYLDYVLTLNRALAIRQNYLEALNSFNQTIISIEYITGKIF